MTYTLSVEQGRIQLPSMSPHYFKALADQLGTLANDGEHIYKLVKLINDKDFDGPCSLELVDGCYRVKTTYQPNTNGYEDAYYFCDHQQTLPAGTIFWARCE